MVTYGLPLIVMLSAALAEYLHVRRCRRMAYLSFGPSGNARQWTVAAAPLRVLCLGALCWSLIILFQIDAAHWDDALSGNQGKRKPHHLVIGLDVSPSMLLKDSGPTGKQQRGDRGRDVLRSVLDRLDTSQTHVSVVAFYSGARPVVIDTKDMNVVKNILNDLPLEYAFKAGKTEIYSSVDVAAEIAKTWAPRSATLIVLSDGDTLPARELAALPSAYASSVVLGVGNRYRGKQIDGHSSRQDARSLEQLALRLRGTYLEVNEKHIPTEQLHQIASSLATLDKSVLGLREAALWAIGISAAMLTLLPVALALAGSGWANGIGPSSDSSKHIQSANSESLPTKTRSLVSTSKTVTDESTLISSS